MIYTSESANPVVATVIMEAPGISMAPKIIKTTNDNGIFSCTFKTILQTFDTVNRNNRIYTKEAMLAGLKAQHIQELIAKRSWVGQNGHPNIKSTADALNIDPCKISHVVLDYEVIGNELWGIVETLNDEQWGKQMTMHAIQGMHMAFSLRALASVVKEGMHGVIRSKPHIVAYDRVILPSHCGAYQDMSTPLTINMPSAKVLRENYEGVDIELTEAAAIEYIKSSSKKVKGVIEMFEVCYESISLSDDKHSVFVKDPANNRTFSIALESYIDRQISDVFAKINRGA